MIDHIDDAVVRARACLHWSVRASLHTVIVASQLAFPVVKVLPFPNRGGLERVTAQHFDEQQVVVHPVLVCV